MSSQINPVAGQPLNPFEGIKGGELATNIQPHLKYKCAVLGTPKSGKSWFAVTAPGYKRVYDFDGRADSILAKPDLDKSKVLVTTLRDTQQSPTVYSYLESELSNLQYRKAKGLPIPDTFIFDSMTYFLNSIKYQYLKDNPKDGRSIRVGMMPVQIGISYDWINTAMRFLDYLFTEYAALGNLIVVFHERDEKDKAESKPNDIRYTGKVTVDPQFISPILSLFNEVFRIEYKNKKFVVTTKQNDEVNASTTLEIDSEEIPDFEAMMKKHQERHKQKVNNFLHQAAQTLSKP